jgi:hypothetical protein
VSGDTGKSSKWGRKKERGEGEVSVAARLAGPQVLLFFRSEISAKFRSHSVATSEQNNLVSLGIR